MFAEGNGKENKDNSLIIFYPKLINREMILPVFFPFFLLSSFHFFSFSSFLEITMKI